MRSRRVLSPLVVACFGLMSFWSSARGELFAVGGMNDLLRIDQRTGKGTRIGYTGAYLPYAMARAPWGTLYFAGWSLASERTHLVTIDPLTGAIKGGPTILIPSALEFSADGTLFAIESYVVNDRLHTIDVDTGASTLVGSTELPGIVALGFSPEGALYGWDLGDSSGSGGLGLVTIDPLSGVAADVNPAVGATQCHHRFVLLGCL